MAAGPDTPTDYHKKAALALNNGYRLAAHMAIINKAMAVTGEDTTVLTTYLATGWAKRQALATEVINFGASKIADSQKDNPPDVIQRIWSVVCANWAQDRDPAVYDDMINQVAAFWDKAAIVVKTDMA